MDGVASASDRRRSTPVRTASNRVSMAPRTSRMTAKAASPGPRALPRTVPATPPPIARDLTAAGRLSIARLAAGSTAAVAPMSSTAACSAGNLRGELSGGLAIVLVLDRQPGVGRRQVVERCLGAPASAEPDQDRKRERDDRGRQRRPQREGEPSDDAARSIRDDNGIASGRHDSPRPPSHRRGPLDFLEQGTLPCGPSEGEVTKTMAHSPRYCRASARCGCSTGSVPARSAIVRETRRTRS